MANNSFGQFFRISIFSHLPKHAFWILSEIHYIIDELRISLVRLPVVPSVVAALPHFPVLFPDAEVKLRQLCHRLEMSCTLLSELMGQFPIGDLGQLGTLINLSVSKYKYEKNTFSMLGIHNRYCTKNRFQKWTFWEFKISKWGRKFNFNKPKMLLILTVIN